MSLKNASFTVESAILMPLVTLVLVLFLFVSMHVYDRAVLRAGAAAALLTGRQQELSVLVLQQEADLTVTGDRGKRTAEWHLLTVPVPGDRIFREEEKSSCVFPDPADILRKAAAAGVLNEDRP